MENGNKYTNVSGRERVYNFIVDYIQRNGYSPSVRDISVGTNLSSTSSVYVHLMKLKLLGKST